MFDPVPAVLTALAAVSDPLDRLRALRLIQAEQNRVDDRISAQVRTTILELRAEPVHTWAVIGDVLGVSPQRAEQLSRARSEPGPIEVIHVGPGIGSVRTRVPLNPKTERPAQ